MKSKTEVKSKTDVKSKTEVKIKYFLNKLIIGCQLI